VSRYHKIDGWRGYWVPQFAIAGASDTGTWEDSPCPTPKVKAELREFAKHMRASGVKVRMRSGTSSNVFCGKRYVVVSGKADYDRALPIAREWFKENDRSTQFIHECEGDDSKLKEAA
jgi:hypothetical protein